MIAEFFLTQLVHTPVLDRAGSEIGIVSDIVVKPGETFPKITGIEITRARKNTIIACEYVDLLSERIITLSDVESKVPVREPSDEDLFLVKDFLDKQILDINGAKVVRVNDLKLARLNGDFHLIAADVGLSGLLRRMKLEWAVVPFLHLLGKRLPEHLIGWNFVEPISGRIPRMKLTVPQSRIAELHPADIAEILTELSPQERAAVMESLDEEKAAEALHDVEPELSLEILDDLTPEKAASIIEEMKPDDAADILAELPEESVQQILASMGAEEADDIKKLLKHGEDTAGGLMTPEFIGLPEHLTAEDTINRLREISPKAETIFYLYVVDKEGHLHGVVSLRDLVVAKPDTPLREIMTSKIVKVSTLASKDDVAELIAKYDLLALPVVDEPGKLMGIITVDDVVDALIPPRWKRRARAG